MYYTAQCIRRSTYSEVNEQCRECLFQFQGEAGGAEEEIIEFPRPAKKKLLDYLHRGGVVETGHLRGETHFGLTRRKLSPSWQFRLCPFGGSGRGKGGREKKRCLAFAFTCTLQTGGPQLHSVPCIRPPILQRGPLGALRSAQRPRHAWETKRCFWWRCLPQRLRRGALAFFIPWNYSDFCRVLPELS